MTDPVRERVACDWLDACRGPMTDLLGRLVDIDSGTHDRAGVDAVGDILREALAGFDLATEVRPGDAYGYTFDAHVPAADGRRSRAHALLLGHRDTVFPKGEAARRPFRVDGDRAYGPGVADMKAGLVMNAFVVAALRRAGGGPLPVVMLCTADEEIASPEGRAVIEAAAAGARAVFNAEPGRVGNGIVTSRNGALFYEVEVLGVAAHSGGGHRHGRSAIEVLAQKVHALHQLTDYDRGITLNVGLVSGGEALNTVAPKARFAFDCRFPTPGALETVRAAIEQVLEREEVPDTRTVVVDRREFLPVEEQPHNRDLFRHYARAAADLGFQVEPVFSGGSADSGFTSALGVPTICGTGPIGEKAHTSDEVSHLDTLVPRAKALALALLRLDDGGAG